MVGNVVPAMEGGSRAFFLTWLDALGLQCLSLGLVGGRLGLGCSLAACTFAML